MLKRFVDNFRFGSSKSPQQSVFEGIDQIQTLLNDIEGSIVTDNANYQEQKSLISQIENITQKLISERKGLVVEKNKLTEQIADAKVERETNMVSAVEKQEYDKIINGLKGTLKEIVKRIGTIDSTLKLQQPSGITTRLQNLLKLSKSIEPNNQSQLQTPDNRSELKIKKQQINDDDLSVLEHLSDTQQKPYTQSPPIKQALTDDGNFNDDFYDNPPFSTKGGYRYPMSSASRKNKSKKSSRNSSVTRGGKRKHTRKHNKKGGNKRKHGRKSNKARK
jgi:hypothetical protein